MDPFAPKGSHFAFTGFFSQCCLKPNHVCENNSAQCDEMEEKITTEIHNDVECKHTGLDEVD